jgi:putative phosphoesterase
MSLDQPEFMVGIISDTHGYLDPQALDAFQGVQLIIHAGDVGKPEVLEELQKIAPVAAVRGNMDWGAWCDALPPKKIIEFGTVLIYVLHDIFTLDLDPGTAGMNVVVSGHSHRPEISNKDNILYVNPGSASLPRHNQTPTVALLAHRRGALEVHIIDLESK